MNTNHTSPTGHSPRQERKFANKLFLGLGIAIVVAFVVVMITSRNSDLKANPAVEQLPAGQEPLPTEPAPVSPSGTAEPVAPAQETPAAAPQK